jgi:hypothetical protein
MMTPPFKTERQGKRRSARELASAAGVALLHVIVIAALVKATYVIIPNHPVAREIEVWFIFPPKPQPKAERQPQ